MTAQGLRLEKISKTFGDFKALDGVDMTVPQGTVHAILGENGAGKTTLMNILYGLYQPDGGRILIDGVPQRITSPRRAMELGIGMIHQHLMLVETLTVVENVVLGLLGQGMRLSLAEHARKLEALAKSFGFDIDPHQEVWKLPMGMRQRVEILKVLYRDANLIILDEPTSVLAPSEVEGFLEGLRRLRAAGKTIIFISHKLDEVAAVADRVTVLRRGAVSADLAVAGTPPSEMARMMVGRDVVLTTLEKVPSKSDEVLVRIRDLKARDNRGNQALKGVSFDIRAGEILGVAGVDGNGQAELAEALTGLRQAEDGTVELSGEDVSAASVYERRHRLGISFVPEDRHGTGLVLDLPVYQNAMIRDFREAPFSSGPMLRTASARKVAEDWVNRYDVRLQSVEQPIRFLSGGNQQKLIFAREVECRPRLLVIMQPCKGLDVGAIEAVHRTVLAERERGTAILYISTELEHILSVCDRVAVMCAGRITGIISPEEATSERIGALIGGLEEEKVA
ncbi:MAG: ATPase [Mesorhizobium sp. 61-13]|nr:MAG: ATPase [Mesorhizobium sp. 61-13]